MPVATDVFVSYGTDTKPLAEELTQALERQGIHVWADFKDLRPGQRWREEIENAADKANSFVILVGPRSASTPRLEAEWKAALGSVWSDSEKTLIPVILGGAEPPPFLRNWVQLHIDPSAESGPWTSRVIDALAGRGGWSAHVRPPEAQRERAQRLDELSEAVDELERAQSPTANESEPAK